MPNDTSQIIRNQRRRQNFELLRAQLELERSSFLPHWRELGDNILPRRPRFVITDTNRGERRSQKIIDATATMAARTLRSGMMSGITSPARPWFKLTTPDPSLAEFGPVREWLQSVTDRMNTVFLRSNIYNVLPIIYGDLGVFGTAAMYLEEDFKDVIRAYPLPIGSYSIANDERLQVRVFHREFRMTVRQVIEKFAIIKLDGSLDFSNISMGVQGLWEANNKEAWVNITHIIQPNDLFQPGNPIARFKRYLSVYYERGLSNPQGGSAIMPSSLDEGKFLRESGFDNFPVLAPRWEVTGEDTYATNCPGMIALGDIKQLQTGERRSLQAIEKKVNPPMVAPTSMKRVKTSILPGDITYTDEREGTKGFRAAHEINFQLTELEEKQNQARVRIHRAFFEDLFLMLARTDRREITAREIDERHEEKLLALGPVLEQLNQDLLDPMVDITFDFMLKQGHIPEPPEELEDVRLKVEYVSIMAQSQKLIGIGTVERFASFANQLGTVVQSALDKVDTDQMVDVYADLTGVPPSLIRSDEEVEAIREERAANVEATRKQEQALAAAKAIKDISANPEASDALNSAINQASA